MSTAIADRLTEHLAAPLAASAWHKSAPGAVRKAYWAGRESAAWKAWQRHLRDRKQTTGRCGEGACLPWDNKKRAPSSHIAGTLRRWLDDADVGARNVDYALSALAWCRGLPQLAAVLPAGDWWKLLQHLVLAVSEAGDEGAGDGVDLDQPLVHQLLAGELGLTLAQLFPEITDCRTLRASARRALSNGLADLLDGKGLLHAKHVDRLGLFLACWTRCRAIGSMTKRGCWSRKAEKRYRQFVRNALRLARRDGTYAFSVLPADGAAVDILRAAVALGGAGDELEIVECVLNNGEKNCRTGSAAKLPKAAIHSEWASVAVLRPDWLRSSPRLTVLYPDASCRIELACGKDVLFSGEWALDVRVDGIAAAPTSDWTELCWVSDGDVDYLELEIDLGERLRVQRHFILARKDRFLLLADAVLASHRGAIEYCGTLPLGSDTSFREMCETREGTLVGRKPRATVLPLALPEWLAERRFGQMTANRATFELRQAAEGQALFAPLFLQLDPARMTEPLTWRQLTVAESHVNQPADAAVGYRVAIGRKQWLIYRSLSGQRSRSLLGHNLRTELLVARFDRDGEVDPLIEIE